MSASNNDLLLYSLQKLLPETFNIQETPIGYNKNVIVGWNSTLYLSNGFPFSGGTAISRTLARRIAIAEALERSLVDRLFLSEKDRKGLLLNEIPSCSGFAAGFSQRKTHLRALCEAVERWAWSKWIDEKFKIPIKKTSPSLSALGNLLAARFHRSQFYEQQVRVGINGKLIELKFLAFIGLSKDGVFPGSRVCMPEDENWDHPLIEASRNHINFGTKRNLGTLFSKNDIIARRSEFFARNANIALAQIDRATKEKWPLFAPLRLWKKVETNVSDVFLSRAVCEDHIPWHLGPIERFVY